MSTRYIMHPTTAVWCRSREIPKDAAGANVLRFLCFFYFSPRRPYNPRVRNCAWPRGVRRSVLGQNHKTNIRGVSFLFVRKTRFCRVCFYIGRVFLRWPGGGRGALFGRRPSCRPQYTPPRPTCLSPCSRVSIIFITARIRRVLIRLDRSARRRFFSFLRVFSRCSDDRFRDGPIAVLFHWYQYDNPELLHWIPVIVIILLHWHHYYCVCVHFLQMSLNRLTTIKWFSGTHQ